ncbi:hypothetical protein H4N54_14955 [Limnospira fusiformis KN01]|uniref:hypothetical protein n=1 Tax=Limnospira TaxID=2596745 RepID=UPI001CA7090E|nr:MULTISPECIES: hypothetical protein [Limnospira]MDT9197599.1 hypothetical protein [Limnospira sp. PMC 1042.18]ULB43771.1 hypothetical protein H4N54_14955 [Limnospira fusiformis KN01]
MDSLIGQWPQSPGHFSPEAFEDDPDLALMTSTDPLCHLLLETFRATPLEKLPGVDNHPELMLRY